MFNSQTIAEYLSLGNAKPAIAIGVLAAPFLSFYGVPIFGVLLVILLIDFLTGLWKAKLTCTLNSNKLSDLLNRTAVYIILFSVVHMLVGTAPSAGPLLTQIFVTILHSSEYMLFLGYCIKESLSVFENLKAIQVVTGRKESRIVEAAIKMFGMDIDKILVDVRNKTVQQATGVDLTPVAKAEEETKQ